MNIKTKAGFTIIELVVVIVVIGILAAVALPRFLSLQDRAHDAVVEGTQAALASGVVMAKSVWLAEGRDSALDNILEKEEITTSCVAKAELPCDTAFAKAGTDTGASLDANGKGFPVSHTQYGDTENAAATSIKNEIGVNAVGHAACTEVFEFLLSESSVRATDTKTTTPSGTLTAGAAADLEFEFIAEATGVDKCTYYYMPDVADNAASATTWREIIYDAQTGRVTTANLSSAGTTSD